MVIFKLDRLNKLGVIFILEGEIYAQFSSDINRLGSFLEFERLYYTVFVCPLAV